jgi:hypothetical protein
MVKWRFDSIPINAVTLLTAFRRGGYSVTADIAALLNVLADPGVDRDAAISVAVSFLKELWALPLLAHQIRDAGRAVLDALVKTRGLEVLTETRSRLRVALRLLPSVAAEADRFVERFVRERLGWSLLL